MILRGENQITRRKICPSATLSTTNPTGLTWARTQATSVRGRRLTTNKSLLAAWYYQNQKFIGNKEIFNLVFRQLLK
jgi:hypothetical protein